LGGARFVNIVKDGALDGTVIYRIVRMGNGNTEAVQFGYVKDEELRRKYDKQGTIMDDPQLFSNPNFQRGMIAFAGGGANTRGTDVFVTFMTGNANGNPGAPWETPFGIINEEGLAVIARFGGTGDIGHGNPEMGRGYDALKTSHPDIDYLLKCRLVNAHNSTLLGVSNGAGGNADDARGDDGSIADVGGGIGHSGYREKQKRVVGVVKEKVDTFIAPNKVTMEEVTVGDIAPHIKVGDRFVKNPVGADTIVKARIPPIVVGGLIFVLVIVVMVVRKCRRVKDKNR
jgi:cyclophilin family peptidyl-prolyl cis-trans isomerase